MENIFSTPVRLKLLLVGVALAALCACASVEPNQNIADAQSRLSAAYNDKMTAERGQGDLANAKSSLGAAQTDWSNGKKDRSDHELTMAVTYLDLAETRGRQASVERDTLRLNQQAQLASRNETIAAQGDTIAGQNQALAVKDRQIAAQGTDLASKNAQLADAQDQLRDYDMKATDLGSTMVLQDVSFETGKSDLLPGGVNRLQALINYLRLSPNTRVRIEGFTDTVGGVAYNQQLSLARANAVKGILNSANIDGGRIDTIGSGLEKPVASNATVSGRQANRRVEITLLKQPGV